LESGGASGFFARIASGSISDNYVVMNPARVHRKLGTYNAAGDTYGRLTNRGTGNTLTARGFAARARTSNETMIKDGVSWMDDIEIAFFGSEREATAAIRLARSRGITHIRGVPVEARFVHRPGNATAYTKTFFDKYVGREGFVARMRRSVTEVLSTTGKKVTQSFGNVGMGISRLKTKKTPEGLRTLARKLSAGRQTRVSVRTGTEYVSLPLRYHETENAVTLAVYDMWKHGVIEGIDANSLTAFMETAGVKNWGHTVNIKFKRLRTQFTGEGLTIDLAEYGVDLRNMSKYDRPNVLRAFVDAVLNGTLDEFKLAHTAV
jgi:hypothetical protein